MHCPGINGEGELREQPVNPDLPGKMAVKMCVRMMEVVVITGTIRHTKLQSNHCWQQINTSSTKTVINYWQRLLRLKPKLTKDGNLVGQITQYQYSSYR